jgi:hypothetical protein
MSTFSNTSAIFVVSTKIKTIALAFDCSPAHAMDSTVLNS